MTTQRHSDELVQAFLAEGPTDLPDQAFDALRGEIHRTRQRTVIGPWRTPTMSNLVRVALAAAVVGAIALAWVNFAQQPGGVGGERTPAATPSQSPGPSASTAGSPAASLTTLHPGPLCSSSGCLTGNIAPGTYSYEVGGWTPFRITFAVPAGWSSDKDGFVTKNTGMAEEVFFTGWQVTHIYPDACHHDDSTVVSAGTTTAELASLLTSQKNEIASATTDVSVGGFPAKRLQLTVPAGLDLTTCTVGKVRLWPDPGPDFGGGYCCFPAGSINDLSIVEAGGQRFVFLARHQPGSSSADRAELQSIVDSIAIEPPSASPSP